MNTALGGHTGEQFTKQVYLIQKNDCEIWKELSIDL